LRELALDDVGLALHIDTALAIRGRWRANVTSPSPARCAAPGIGRVRSMKGETVHAGISTSTMKQCVRLATGLLEPLFAGYGDGTA